MVLNPEVPYLEFMQRVAAKFETTVQSIALKFRDEDGGKVSLRDESDHELAIETARESAKGRPEGKLELWCEINYYFLLVKGAFSNLCPCSLGFSGVYCTISCLFATFYSELIGFFIFHHNPLLLLFFWLVWDSHL